MDTDVDPFPEQMSKAAVLFPNFSAAYAQLHAKVDSNNMDIHIQAPEIMMRFSGQVQFGEGSPVNSSSCAFVFDPWFQIPREFSSMNRSRTSL